MRIIFIFALFLTIQSCKSISIEDIKNFVDKDNFASIGVYPSPQAASDEMYMWCKKEFSQNNEVRRVLALYFLRYDSVLLKKSLISSGHDRLSLINILFEEEKVFESPSMTNMRQKLSERSSFYNFNDEMRMLVDENNQRLKNFIGN